MVFPISENKTEWRCKEVRLISVVLYECSFLPPRAVASQPVNGEEVTINISIGRVGWGPGRTRQCHISQITEVLMEPTWPPLPGQGTPCSLRCPGTPHNLRLYGFQASVPEYGQISTHLPADVKEWNPSFHYFLQKVLFYFISTTICVLYLKYSINGPNWRKKFLFTYLCGGEKPFWKNVSSCLYYPFP